jgi:hypothetical protein
VWCDAMVSGELAHSCRHGAGPHQIKMCVTKKGNAAIWSKILKLAEPASHGDPTRT